MPDLTSESSPGGGQLFGHRFRVARLLKAQHGIATHLGVDAETGREVVIKTAVASTVSPAAQMRLEHEARALRDVRGPTLAPLLAFGHDGDALYLVMPYLSGATLAERLREGPLPAREAIDVARAVLAALEEAHARGVLHRDVKPANIILGPSAGVGQTGGRAAGPAATLVDFGLARSVWLDAGVRDQPVGTVRYMSPEQAGVLERGVDARSDLYSLGIVLFECLAGRPPFLGETIGEVLRQHLSAAPPELRSLGSRPPRALEEVVQRSLRKDPRDRYQSAGAVIADLDEIAAALDRGVADPPLAAGLHDRRASLTEPSFVGRRAELDALEAALARAKAGAGGLVTVEAESGGGKTRLLDELGRRASHDGAWVLRGQAIDHAAQRPLEILSGIVRGVIEAGSAEPALAARIRERLGDERETVCAALPRLAEVLGPCRSGDGALGPEAYGEARSLPALAAFLDVLGEAGRPALVILDDAQWADELSVRLLGHWRARARAPHVLVVVAFRAEEVAGGHALRALGPAAHVALAPLPADDVRRLLESMGGALPDEVVALVTGLSHGSPFMAGAVLQGLVEQGALVAGAEGWSVDRAALDEASSSRLAAAFLTRRLEVLPAATLRLLAVGAILGKRFDLDLAANLAGGPPAEAIAAIDEARRRQIVWTDALGARCAFVHDKLREALLARLSDEERRRLHLAAAARIEAELETRPGAGSSSGSRAFELAYHFDAAGEPARALPYALEAAARARAQHGLEVAERQYRIARAGAADAATRERVAEGLGDVLMLRGRYDEAAPELEAARALATTDLDRARIEGKLGELSFKRGDTTTATASLERALRLLGRLVPRSAALVLAMLLWEILIQLVHTVFPRLTGRRALAGADGERLAMRVYSRLAYAYWFERGRAPCAWAHLREMNLAERYPETPELAQAYSEHAPVMTMLPWFARGIAYAERSLAIRRRLGDIWGEGQSLHFHGVVLYGASRYRECLEKCREAVRLLERTGDRWEANTAEWHVAYCLYRLGDLAGAVEVARRVHRSGLAIGDHQASGISVAVWAKASGGRVPEAVVAAELARQSGDVHTRAEVLQAEALRLLGDGRPLEAAALLERAQALVEAAGLKQEYVAPILPWLATALRRALEETPPLAGERRAALLGRARVAARRGLRLARSYSNNLPHALRELALLAAIAGRPRRARRLLDGALRVAAAQGARLEEAETRLARGRVGLVAGWRDAAEDLAQARRQLAALGAALPASLEAALPLIAANEVLGPGTAAAPAAAQAAAGPTEVTPSLADRFATVLSAGRRIASSLSRDQVFGSVGEASLTLLRGERCTIVALDERGEPRSSEAGAPFSRSMVRDALAAGRPVVRAEYPSADVAESVLLAGVRSALCAPIFVRGRADACLYVTHGRVGGLFGESEERLAEFVTVLAGAALENAAGFATVEALSEERARLYREAQNAVQLRDEFLSIAGHELRTPLTALQLNLQAVLLRERRANPGVEGAAQVGLESVERQVRRLARLVDDLLDISRIAGGRLDLDLEEVDLRVVLHEVVERLRADAERAGSRVSLSVEGRVAGRWDRLRLDQIVTNLLTNAIKYGGGKPIDVRLEGENGCARLAVTDRGIGIAAEDQARIFDRFERAVSSRHYGGFGLGLWIVRQIVQAFGGSITVVSRPGQGSTFTVDLPREQVETPAVP